MADLAQLEKALLNAHNAGDTEAARVLAGEIKRMRAPAAKTYDPTEDMSGLDKFRAGMGKAFYDVGRGVKQLVGGMSREEMDAIKQQDAALMNTGAGLAGNVLGNVAIATPLAAIPGANTILGGGAIGAATGLLQPVGTQDSRASNVITGGVAGAAVPAAMRGYKAVKAAVVDPFTVAGRDRIAGRVLNNVAADASTAAQNLAAARGVTPGFNPTTGQAADDAGVAAMERMFRATNPSIFGGADDAQRRALADAVRGIAKDKAARDAAVEQVEQSAKRLYGEAFKESVPVTPALQKIASKPSVRAAESRALQLADELGIPFQARLADMKPQYIPMEGRVPAPSSVLEAQPYNPYRSIEPQVTEKLIPGQRGLSSYFEVPPVESVPVRDMHTLKMGMDALLQDPTKGIAGREAQAVRATRERLLDLMPESYQAARLNHIEMNKPVHQMDIGQELVNKFVPSLYRDLPAPPQLNAKAFSDAITDRADDLAKNVTGLKNAKLAEILAPEQMATLKGVAKNLQTMKAAEMVGKGVGSDTVQKMAMSNIAAEAGVPNWIGSIARVPGGWVKRAGDVLYGSADDQVRQRLAELLLNPQEASQVMTSTLPAQALANGGKFSTLPELLKDAARAQMFALPAIVNAQQ